MSDSIRRILLLGFLAGSVAIAVAVYAFARGAAQLTLSAPKNSLPPSRIAGIGINCHSESLPVDDLKAIGVSWVRIDVPGGPSTFGRIKPLVDHYRDFGQLWVLPQSAGDVGQAAKVLVAAGVTEIEVFNEPDLNGITPSSYVRSFRAVRQAVGASARLYGQSLCTWLDRKSYL